MTTNVKQLAVSEADFFALKSDLRDYLKTQSIFADYDFTGSGFNILLDILAYDHHYVALTTNLSFAETFLDSAEKRASVVSRAKELNYLPRSKSASSATISISFSVTGSPSQFVLPKNTAFSASTDQDTFTFVTVQDYIIDNDGNGVFSAEIEIKQGKLATYSYTVNTADASQRFIVPSVDADIDFLTVNFRNNSTDTAPQTFSYIDTVSIGNLNGSSTVYFLKEAFDGYYELYFGDGVIGLQLQTGNVIDLQYLVTDGDLANGTKAFTLASSVPTLSAMSITSVDSATGGSDKETVASIKHLAPLSYQAQQRAVTEDDYKVLISRNYSDVADIQVWGGEKNVPPFYGKVFAAIKPSVSKFFSNTTKQAIVNDIASRFNIVGTRIEIVDPDYIDVKVNTIITYNARLFNPASNYNLQTAVTQSITDFFNNEANKFGQPLYYSQLTTAIDATNTLIINSITNLSLSKSTEIFSGISGKYEFDYNNSIYPGSINSNQFTIGGVTYKVKDIPDGIGLSTGVLAIYPISDNTGTVFYSKTAGTVDYNAGVVTLTNVKIDTIVGDPIYKRLIMSVSPGPIIDPANPTNVYSDRNVYTNARDQIIRLADNGITLTLLPDNSV